MRVEFKLDVVTRYNVLDALQGWDEYGFVRQGNDGENITIWFENDELGRVSLRLVHDEFRLVYEGCREGVKSEPVIGFLYELGWVSSVMGQVTYIGRGPSYVQDEEEPWWMEFNRQPPKAAPMIAYRVDERGYALRLYSNWLGKDITRVWIDSDLLIRKDRRVGEVIFPLFGATARVIGNPKLPSVDREVMITKGEGIVALFNEERDFIHGVAVARGGQFCCTGVRQWLEEWELTNV